MSGIYKFSSGILAVVLILYLSLDIQNLEKHRQAALPISFNASDFAAKFWADSLSSCMATAPRIEDFLKMLDENPIATQKRYGHKLGISKTYYFMVTGKGNIEKVEDEFLIVDLDDKSKIKIATDFIYGNAVREGSGKVNIDYFLNMTDFNNVSVAINKLVKEKIASRLKKNAQVGKTIEFVGALEISEENIDSRAIPIIPVSAKLSDGKAE